MMSLSICPECGKKNLENTENCQFCGSSLINISDTTDDSSPNGADSPDLKFSEPEVDSEQELIEFSDMQFSEQENNQAENGHMFDETEDDYLRLLQNLDPDSIKLEDLLVGGEKSSPSAPGSPDNAAILNAGVLQVNNQLDGEFTDEDETTSAANASLDWLNSLSNKTNQDPFTDGLTGSETAEPLINGLPAWLSDKQQKAVDRNLPDNDGLPVSAGQDKQEDISSKWYENTGELLPDQSHHQEASVNAGLVTHDTELFSQTQNTDTKPDDLEQIPEWLAVLQNQDLNNNADGITTELPLPDSASPDGLPEWFVNLQKKLDELTADQGDQSPVFSEPQVDESDNNNIESVFQENQESSFPDLDSQWTAPFITDEPHFENEQVSKAPVQAFTRDATDEVIGGSITAEEPELVTVPVFVEEVHPSQNIENPEFSSLLDILRSSILTEPEDDFGELPKLSTGIEYPGQESILSNKAVEKNPSSVLVQPVTASDTQSAQAHLLKNLILSENTPINFPIKREPQTNHRLRWLIAIVLVVSIFIAAISKASFFPIPVSAKNSGSTNAFIGVINGLSGDSRILFVTDYQPSFTGEIELISNPVINQLIKKNVSISFISTTPTGVYLSDRLIAANSVSENDHAGLIISNLGYLPGGASGIRAFFENTLSQTEPGYSAVIVAADDPDTAKLWIEQVKTQSASIPMLLISSSQAEILMQPYFSSMQLAGILSGMEGAVLYEKETSAPGKAQSYWNSFGIGIIILELFMVIGMFWILTSFFSNRRKLKEGVEE
ncbi:MAG: hypothetical protein WCP19_00765 [Chloroflexota bacterium]